MGSCLLLDHLNQGLGVELFAGDIYPQYAQQAQDPAVKARLEELGLESDKHRGTFAQLIADLSGSPSPAKELMAITSAWTKGFLDIGRGGAQGMLR